MGKVKTINNVTGYAGLRRHSASVPYVSSAGASMPLRGIITPERGGYFTGGRMNYSETFMRQHEEMCQVVGSIVFALAEAGHESRRDNIVAVLRNELAESGK